MKSNTSLSSLLSHKGISESEKEKILKELRVILSFPTDIDSQPADLYRHLGQQTIRLQLITDLNNFINYRFYNCSFQEWSEELMEIKHNCEKLINTLKDILKVLLQEGNQTGLYEITEGD